jgi:hypothetical protein
MHVVGLGRPPPILVDRNLHKSATSLRILGGADPVWRGPCWIVSARSLTRLARSSSPTPVVVSIPTDYGNTAIPLSPRSPVPGSTASPDSAACTASQRNGQAGQSERILRPLPRHHDGHRDGLGGAGSTPVVSRPQEIDMTDLHWVLSVAIGDATDGLLMKWSCTRVRTQARWRALEPSRALVAGSRPGRPRQRSRSTDSASRQTARRHSQSRLPGRNSRR